MGHGFRLKLIEGFGSRLQWRSSPVSLSGGASGSHETAPRSKESPPPSSSFFVIVLHQKNLKDPEQRENDASDNEVNPQMFSKNEVMLKSPKKNVKKHFFLLILACSRSSLRVNARPVGERLPLATLWSTPDPAQRDGNHCKPRPSADLSAQSSLKTKP